MNFCAIYDKFEKNKRRHLYYIIGLITAGGNLNPDRRHITIVSKDKEILIKVKGALSIRNKIGCKRSSLSGNKIYYVLHIGSKTFYDFLEKKGLTINRSLVLKQIKVPKEYFKDFLRGVIDGDGSIVKWKNKENGNFQWSLKIYSGSWYFIIWLKGKIEKIFEVNGRLYKEKRNRRNCLYFIKFGKLATRVILKFCYYKDCICLNRKYLKARECIKDKNRLIKYRDVISPRWWNW